MRGPSCWERDLCGGVNTDDAVIGSFFPELGCLKQALGLIVAGSGCLDCIQSGTGSSLEEAGKAGRERSAKPAALDSGGGRREGLHHLSGSTGPFCSTPHPRLALSTFQAPFCLLIIISPPPSPHNSTLPHWNELQKGFGEWKRCLGRSSRLKPGGLGPTQALSLTCYVMPVKFIHYELGHVSWALCIHFIHMMCNQP